MAKPKRYTVTVGDVLHTRMKVACAIAGKPMGTVVRELLEREFGAKAEGASKVKAKQPRKALQEVNV